MVEQIIDPKEAIELNDSEQLMFALLKQAEKLKLDIFIFEKDEIRKYYKIDETRDFAIVTLASNRENGLWNLQNQRHCYIINDYLKQQEQNESRN